MAFLSKVSSVVSVSVTQEKDTLTLVGRLRTFLAFHDCPRDQCCRCSLRKRSRPKKAAPPHPKTAV